MAHHSIIKMQYKKICFGVHYFMSTVELQYTHYNLSIYTPIYKAHQIASDMHHTSNSK